MGSFEYRDAISVIQIVIFPIFLWFGLKFKREQKPGWVSIGFLSLCRITGGSCMLALITRNTRGLWAAVLVYEAIGILLLVFLLLELLEKMFGSPFLASVSAVANEVCRNNATTLVHKKVCLIPQLIAYVDLGVSIVGFVMVGQGEDALAPTSYSRAGIALNAVIYFWMVGTFSAICLRGSQVSKTHKPILICVAICIPFLAVRIAYALLYVITANKLFNAIVGNPTIYLLLTTFPEITVVGVCSWTISKLELPEGSAKEEEMEDTESGRSVPVAQSQSK